MEEIEALELLLRQKSADFVAARPEDNLRAMQDLCMYQRLYHDLVTSDVEGSRQPKPDYSVHDTY
jgi:hypothetical protein